MYGRRDLEFGLPGCRRRGCILRPIMRMCNERGGGPRTGTEQAGWMGRADATTEEGGEQERRTQAERVVVRSF